VGDDAVVVVGQRRDGEAGAASAIAVSASRQIHSRRGSRRKWTRSFGSMNSHSPARVFRI
jgi:hypothetical protein